MFISRHAATTAMGIGSAKIEEKWSLVVGLNKGLAPIGHLDRAAGITRQGSVKLVDRFGAHVVLANPRRSIAGRRHSHRQTFYVVIGTKVMVGV